MNIIGVILIIVFVIFIITLWIFIMKLSTAIKMFKSTCASVKGVGKVVNGVVTDYKVTGIDMVKTLLRGKLNDRKTKK